ncbi:tyrosine-type recombinase/integrase [uncultured Vagococcus sp.]|uniref:tyrosine-type recombinase/integrase n=1 Tax=uncultured Vagococcus sp. TaxID=189676 RepID=UPI0028D6A186|nr:tyrosine-type recombinase/integrase [uncultured Vagococcus sp.]
MIINLEEYRQYLKETKKAEGTIVNYMTQLRMFEKFMIANGYTGLSGEATEAYKDYLLKIKKDKVSSVNTKITILNTYFNYLKNQKKVRRTRKLKLKKEKIQSTNDREYLIESQYAAIYENCVHSETQLLIKVIANSGLRISEATGLTLDQIKPKKIMIKNKGKWRTIGLKPELKAEIRAFFKDKKPDEPLFSLSQTTYRNRMSEAGRLAGVESELVYPHAFRHYFAKEFLRTAEDQRALRVLQVILGHSDISTTMIYLQFSNTEVADMMIAA